MTRVGVFVFTLHTLLELFLGAIKVIKGGYKGFEMPPGGEKFAMHHGVSLMSLALLGGLVLHRRSWSMEEGFMVSLVLCCFHAGCVAIRPDAAVLLLHGLLAIGFAYHCLVTEQQQKGTQRQKKL